MAKLFKILAASVGSGLVLGAGIRLGEAFVAQYPAVPGAGEKLAERLGELEQRLVNLEETSTIAGSRFQSHGAELAGLRAGIDLEKRQVDLLEETSLQLRGELRGWLEESVSTRMAEVEARLKAESERGQKQLLDAFAESVQTRVIHRISRLEEEVAGQSAAMTELRECSLRTERSMQKLLGGLDKLLIKNPPEAGVPEAAAQDAGTASETGRSDAPLSAAPEAASSAGPETTIETARQGPSERKKASPFTVQPLVSGPLSSEREQPAPAVEPPSFIPPPKPSRWKIFG